MGAVGQHQSASAQAAAANEELLRQYKYQIKDAREELGSGT